MKITKMRSIAKPTVLVVVAVTLLSLIIPAVIAASDNAAAHMTVSYEVIGGGTGYTAPTLNYFTNGNHDQHKILTTSPETYGLDGSSAWSVTSNPLQGSTNQERWYCYQTAGTTPATGDSVAMVFTFYHQYMVSFSITGLDSDAGSYTVLTIGTTNYDKDHLPTDWLNASTSFTWAPEISGGEGVRFILVSPTSAVGTMTGPGTYSATYQKQYQVSFTVNPTAGGSITTPTENSVWVNAGEKIDIAANANSGYTFSSWTSNVAPLITFDAQIASTKATINSAGTITANFIENTPHYNFIGFLPPIGTAGHTDPKGFKFGSTIPVKFQLLDDDENYVSNAIVTLWYGMGSNNVRAGDFRYDTEEQQYVFNLRSGLLSLGTWTLYAKLNDGTILGYVDIIVEE